MYTGLTLAAQAVYGTDAWSRNGEGFGVYFGLFARLSAFERRDGARRRARAAERAGAGSSRGPGPSPC